MTNAADPTSHPDHVTIARLEPWSVKKVFCVSEDPDQATVRLTTAQLASHSHGGTATESAADKVDPKDNILAGTPQNSYVGANPDATMASEPTCLSNLTNTIVTGYNSIPFCLLIWA